MSKFDDSSLFHARGTYDPVKAREYYLRTRKLKGRRKSTASLDNPGKGGRRPKNVPANITDTVKSKQELRRAELLAQREALEKRLDRLREVLAAAVEAAKKRSGPAQPEKSKSESSEKDKAPETTRDKADRVKESKKDKPETAAQKKERAKRAKEAYEKEKPNSLSTDVKILQSQIKDVREKIVKALADARARQDSDRGVSGSMGPRRGQLTSNTSRRDDSNVRARYQTNSEPRGR